MKEYSYYEVIKNPMDLSTMGAKLEAGMYKDRFAFEGDFHLMVSNAKQYSPAGTYAHTEAIFLETFFEKRESDSMKVCITGSHFFLVWNRIQKTLEAASKNAELVPVESLPTIVVKKRTESEPPAVSGTPLSPPPAPSGALARPVIKLKVGSQAKAPPPEPSKKVVEQPKASQKPKQRKPKAIDEAPPPYVDDGSHDLLQEVIAIEREKDEEKRTRKVKDVARESPPARASGSGPPGKRRKTSANDDEGEDEILSLAPSLTRKEKPNAPSLSSTPVVEPVVDSTPRVSVSKPKKDKPANLRDSESVADTPRISIKGKEKEVVPSNTFTPSKPRKGQAPAPLNEKKCRDILRAILRVPESIIFAQPVDPERDGCPT